MLRFLCAVAAISGALACGLGTYASGGACVPCAAGRYSTAQGATDRLTCQPCPAGHYHPDSTSDPKSTLTGAASLAAACTICPAGMYSDIASSRSCQACAPGTYRSTAGASRRADCVSCVGPGVGLRKSNATGDFVSGATSAAQTCEARAVPCLFSPWGAWSRCTLACGGGRQSRTRSQTQTASNGGAACPSGGLDDARDCNTATCSALHTRFPLYAELLDGAWWQLTFGAAGHDGSADTAAGMSAECRWQKDEPDGPWAYIPNAENVRIRQDGSEVILQPGLGDAGAPRELDFSAPAGRRLAAQTATATEAPYLGGVVSRVEGWCCRPTTAHARPIGKSWCYETVSALQQQQVVLMWGKQYTYNGATGRMCRGARCAQFKPLAVHRQRCKSITCRVEDHTCTKYDAADSPAACQATQALQTAWEEQGGAASTAHPAYCPNAGWGTCKMGQGETKRSLRVTHAHDEDHKGHFCAETSAGRCECYCHDIYANQASSPHFDTQHTDAQNVTHNTTTQNGAKFGRNACLLPADGAGSQYDVFSATTPLDFGGTTYRPVGPCTGVGCYVLRGQAYDSACDLRTEAGGSKISPALRALCADSAAPLDMARLCNSALEPSSQCAVNLWQNGAERATFFRAKNNLGAAHAPSSNEGLYFYNYQGQLLLHISPDGAQFQGQNQFNYFAAVPEGASYALLRGGGASSDGDDYSGIDVSFYTCDAPPSS